MWVSGCCPEPSLRLQVRGRTTWALPQECPLIAGGGRRLKGLVVQSPALLATRCRGAVGRSTVPVPCQVVSGHKVPRGLSE